MSRYPWERAPEWAKYAATDRNGDRYWFEEQPTSGYGLWILPQEGRCMEIYDTESGWDESLE